MKKKELEAAENAIRKIAQRDGVTVEFVRKQMRLAMLSGLCSMDPKHKAYWDSIPREGEYPTPEELIAYTAGIVRGMKKIR